MKQRFYIVLLISKTKPSRFFKKIDRFEVSEIVK